MAHCPGCGANLPHEALECGNCGALFGPDTSWSPVEDGDPRAPTTQQDNANRTATAGTVILAIIVGLFVLACLAAFAWAFLIFGAGIAVLGAGGNLDPHVFLKRIALGEGVLLATYCVAFLWGLIASRPFLGIGIGLAGGTAACLLTWMVGLWIVP